MSTATQNWIDRKGIFRGSPLEARITQGQDGSQSMGLEVVYGVAECLDGNDWANWSTYQFIARGTLWIIKKDGSLNDKAAETARDVLGWDGDLENVSPERLRPCQFTVKDEEYNGKTLHKIAWFNDYDFKPGPRTLDAGAVSTLKITHGAKLRAFFGATKPASKPSGIPSAPPPTTAKKTLPPPPPAPAAKAATTATAELVATSKDTAWAYVVEACGTKMNPTEQWGKTWTELFDGRHEDELTESDWSRLAEVASLPF